MSESERYGSISRSNFLDTLPPVCAHEWESVGIGIDDDWATGNVTTIHLERCLHCRQPRERREGTPSRERP